MKINNLDDFNKIKEKGLKQITPIKPRISIGMDTCGIGNGAKNIYQDFKKLIKDKKIDAFLTTVGCFGLCSQEPLVNLYLPGKPLLILKKVKQEDVKTITDIIKNKDYSKIDKLQKNILCKVIEWDHHTSTIKYGEGYDQIPVWNDVPFFKWQKKLVLRNCGLINPESIEEYIAVGGYYSLYKTFNEFSPDQVIKEVKKSKLRGRGGAGFPTWKKWEIMENAKAEQKFIVCNADEGDPGAYMNRNELESDPHMIIEGMIIGGYAMGSSNGIIYIRAEYPLAVSRLKKALEQARGYGLIGENILNSGFSFDIDIVEGAGAFVCGEETALISSIENKQGRSLHRPPYPAQKGINGYPTNINNVETWCNIPLIINKGGDWFTKTGTDNNTGTKVFSLVGKVNNVGLVELPLGETLNTLVYKIGEGSIKNKKIKAVQTGGPSGGCIPVTHFDTPVDYESLTSLGSIMGSGGIVVMDEDNCLVDVANYFLEFTTNESCGKCVPCREGLNQAHKILKLITKGKATENDIKELEILCNVIKDTALCGLGQTGPNPVLTTLKYFRQEYEEHFKEKRCHAGICEELYLTPCENTCPIHMNIPGFITLLKEDRIDEAFLSAWQENPFLGTTGRICHHPCDIKCRRVEIDESILPRDIHRYIADTIYKKNMDVKIIDKFLEQRFPENGKKIAIVGSGPAGLTAAFYLALLGYKVTVYESYSKPGGMLRLTIPPYRLPRAILDREIKNIERTGVEVILNKKINNKNQLKKLEDDFDAVFFAIGAQNETPFEIEGKNLKGVFSGIQLLIDICNNKKDQISKNSVVIGGGNVAIDVARTLLRMGSKVTVVYRRENKDMPALKEEVEEAELEGIEFVYLAGPKKIIGDGKGNVKGIEVIKMKPGDFDSSGRRRPVPTNETFEVVCDTVVLAIGQQVDSKFLQDYGIKINKDQTMKVDHFTLQTNNSKFYAGGDMVTGSATVTEAMFAGKIFAKLIDYKLTGKQVFDKVFNKFIYSQKAVINPEGHERKKAKKILFKAGEIKNKDKEVLLGLSADTVKYESIRCLRCDIKESE